MSVVATLLFGSLARADESEGSDTDLLMVNLDNETRHISVGRLALFLYPWPTLEQNAHDGDLFVCHLVREAKPLLDPDDYLPKLKEAFRFRSDYVAVVARATDLGWYLARFGEDLNSPSAGQASALVHPDDPHRPQRGATRPGLRSSPARRADSIGRRTRPSHPPTQDARRCGSASVSTPLPGGRNDVRPIQRTGRPHRLHGAVQDHLQQSRAANATAGRTESSCVLLSTASLSLSKRTAGNGVS